MRHLRSAGIRVCRVYEDFIHDEVHDVMMSICDEVPFRVSKDYPSTERVRVYEVGGDVEFEPEPYEEYLDGWSIGCANSIVIFVKGDLEEAFVSWLNGVYGDLVFEPDPFVSFFQLDDGASSLRQGEYVNSEGAIFDLKYKDLWDKYVVHVDYDRIWSLFEYYGMEDKGITRVLRKWLAKTYKIKGVIIRKG